MPRKSSNAVENGLSQKNNADRISPSDDDEEEDRKMIDLKTIEFLNKSQLEFSNIQSADERRQIRQNYRTLIEETERICEDIDAVQTSDLKHSVDRASILFAKVRLPREGAYDTHLLKQCSDLGKKKASILQTGLQQFNEDNFAKQIISFLKNDNADINFDSQDEDEPTSSRRETILTRAHWESLGEMFGSNFKIAPGLNFLSTCLERDPAKIKPPPERKRREARKKDVVGDLVKPKKLCAKSDETEEEKTTKFVENVHNCLKTAYQMLGEVPINYFDFIVDPRSFEKTIENIFHLSFLIKDGFAKMSMDNQNLPIIEPIDKVSGPDAGSNQQCIISLNYDDWMEIVQAFKIEEPLIN